MIIIFDSNSSNFGGMIFQNPKKISKYQFSFKSYSNLKYLRILQILGHSLITCMGKHKSNLQLKCLKDFNGFALPRYRYNGYLKPQAPPLTNVTKISVPPFNYERENFLFPLRLHFTALISVQPYIVKIKK